MNTELINRMKTNWTALGGLTDEEKACLEENCEHVQWRNNEHY